MHARAVDQAGAQQMIAESGRQIADRLGLELWEGNGYVEIRPPGTDKGTALNKLVEETGARAVIFGGDAFNDVPAYAELHRLTAENDVPGIAVFSDIPGADESLRAMADLVVPGEPGIHAVMREIIDMTPIRAAA